MIRFFLIMCHANDDENSVTVRESDVTKRNKNHWLNRHFTTNFKVRCVAPCWYVIMIQAQSNK